MVVGGKTGTGDNRTDRYARGGRVIGSVTRSRTATFVFFIGDRWYGTVTAHVEGADAARYRFTSALPTQLFKRSEEHTSELQSLMRISYAVFCLKKKNTIKKVDKNRNIKWRNIYEYDNINMNN